jgi:hypothetical protein
MLLPMLMALFTTSAYANFTYSEVTPAAGSTVSEIETISITFNAENGCSDNPVVNPVYLMKDDTLVAYGTMDTGAFWDEPYNKTTIKFSPAVTAAGEYDLYIAAGYLNEYANSDNKNDLVKIHYTIEGTSTGDESQTSSTFTLAVTAPALDRTNWTGSDLSAINLVATGCTGTLTPSETILPTMKSANGDVATSVTLKYFYGTIIVNTTGVNKSGAWTLTIPEGALVDEAGKKNAASSFTWANFQSDVQEGGEQGEFVATELKLHHGSTVTDILSGNAELDRIYTDDYVTINTAATDANIVYMRFHKYTGVVDEDGQDGEIVWFGYSTTRTDDGWKITYNGSTPVKFSEDATYAVELYAYDREDVAPSQRKSWTSKSYAFKGVDKPYDFSTVKLVSLTPELDSDIEDENMAIVMAFSAPVEVVTDDCYIETGGSGVSVPKKFESIKSSADKTVWMFTPGASLLNSLQMVKAITAFVDLDGKRLEGGYMEEEKSCYYLTFDCLLSYPKVKVTPETGSLAEIYDFTAYCEGTGYPSINISHNCDAYLTSASGAKLAKVDRDDYVLCDADGKEIAIDDYDSTAKSVKFHLTKKITSPGVYYLDMPFAFFALGTEFNGKSSGHTVVRYDIEGDPALPTCSVEENEQLGKVGLVAFYIEQAVDVAEGTNIRLDDEEGSTVTQVPATVWEADGITILLGDFTSDSEAQNLEAGKYAFVIAKDKIAQMGTDYKYPETKVNFTVGNAAEFVKLTHSVCGHASVVAAVEKGKSAVLNLTPAEGWKVKSVTYNGEDVTSDVAEGVYTTPALEADAVVAAEMEYDGVTVTPTGVNDVVTDLNLRAWSEAGNLVVSGLAAGQVVNVYTVGGALVANYTVAGDDTVSLNVAADTYIITVTDNGKTVAIKLNHK